MELDASPVVSVCVITYNHVTFIGQCLQSIVDQETDFKIEVIVHDDASTDGTKEVINRFHREFPELIFPILQNENQYSQGIRIWPQIVFPQAKGRYIAICEGDDYWMDTLKLQKQIDFMKSNEECSLVFHACLRNSYGEERIVRYDGSVPLDLNQYLSKLPFAATASLLFKRTIIQHYEPWMYKLFAGDFVIRYLAFLEGKMGYIDDVMSVYNKGVPGSWSSRNLIARSVIRDFRDNLKMLYFMEQKISNLDVRSVQKKTQQLKSNAYMKIFLSMSLVRGIFYLINKKISLRRKLWIVQQRYKRSIA